MSQPSELSKPRAANGAARPSFKIWLDNDFPPSEFLPGIPPNAKLRQGSTVRERQRGKVPGKRHPDGTWGGFNGWSEHRSAVPELKRWNKWGANICLQTRAHPVADMDVEDGHAQPVLGELALKHLGPAPVRYREGSARRLRLYCLAPDEPPMKKRRLAWKDANGEVQAVELLGDGQQCIVGGIHPSGRPYVWDTQPSAFDLMPITAAQVDAFFTELEQLVKEAGFEIVTFTRESGSSSGMRKSLDDPSLWAPSPQHVLDVLKLWRPEHMDHDDYVQATAAIKAALGADREHYFADFLEWSPGVRSSEYDEGRKRWDSVDDSELGWEWLAGKARAFGYSDDADEDFGVGADDARDLAPETPYDRMVQRTVYVSSQGLYYDTEDGELRSPQAFRAKHTGVTPFGSSGQKTADAIFQNAEDARKVSTIAVKPGADVLTETKTESGMVVSAVNLWRPSPVKANLKATTADIAPWLDLLEKLFGPAGAPEREHFLDWCAYVLQNPGKKIGHAVVLVGNQGVGKDTVLRPFFEGVGVHNVQTIDNDTLAGQWNFYLKAPVIYVQEASKHRADFYNKLKPYLSAQKTLLAVNEKHMRQWLVENFQNWILTTNFDDALRLEDGDRRFWIHRVLIDEPPPEEYFAKLHAWLDAGGIECVFGWLLQRDAFGFNPMATPATTAAKRAMLEASLPAGVRWVVEQFREGAAFEGRTVITVAELTTAARNEFSAPDVSDKQAISALKTFGFKSTSPVRIGQDIRALWVRDPSLLALPPAKLRERYLAESQNLEAVA